MIIVARYQTIGDEVYDNELGPTIGYDNIHEGYVIFPNEDCMADWYEPETIRSCKTICEVQTIGM